jgi:Ca2+-binding EF-hand superfamily protein
MCADDDGVLTVDEFTKLCNQYTSAGELSDAEIRAALDFLDTNKDGSLSFSEFVKFYLKNFQETNST